MTAIGPESLESEGFSDWDEAVDTSVQSGTLGVAGRAAAVSSALGLVSQYFAEGSQQLIEGRALARGDDASDKELFQLIAALRLRVALAAANRLLGILERISWHPTFAYRQRSIDSTGGLSGQLDINKYVADLGTYQDSTAFPVIDVYRSSETPENVLAVYATLWLIDELRASFAGSVAPLAGPEYKAWAVANAKLRRHIERPTFKGCVREARRIKRRLALMKIVGSARMRLRRREIANPSPYRELVEWVEKIQAGDPIMAPGDVEWLFYGERFDSKLFELWCLHELGSELAQALGEQSPTVGAGWRSGKPVYRFDVAFGSLEVYFQRGLGGTDHPARWATSEGKPLPGIPDIVVIIHRKGAEAKIVLLDPKLKQRARLPVEDVYKVIGYLDNFRIVPPIGFVLAHTTSRASEATSIYYDSLANGLVGIAKLNPVADKGVTGDALLPVVDTLIGLLNSGAAAGT